MLLVFVELLRASQAFLLLGTIFRIDSYIYVQVGNIYIYIDM